MKTIEWIFIALNWCCTQWDKACQAAQEMFDNDDWLGSEEHAR